MNDAFVGIDVAFAKGKRLPIVIARWVDGDLVPYSLRSAPFEPPRGLGNRATLDEVSVRAFALEAVHYVESVCAYLSVNPKRIALDAPSMPTNPGEKRRAAEKALDASGISCFTTPSAADFEKIAQKVQIHLAKGGQENRLPHANQLWMMVGFELYRAFSKLAPCLEVFPQATIRMLGAGALHKSKQGGVSEQMAAVSSFTGWPSSQSFEAPLAGIAFGPTHDALDAYLSAWVAALPESDRVALGKPPDDVIWVPRINSSKKKLRSYSSEHATTATAVQETQFRVRPPASKTGRRCPACDGHFFVQWPLGWDAHAAYKCEGLAETDHQKRKAEFKAKYL